MDFLDSLDLQTHSHKQDKKYDRMRSWYLYEQYKSLEQHQLDAAQKLRERSLQERLLQRELAERRSRRRLYQPVGACRSEPQAQRNSSHAGTCLSTTTDDFYESFCELHDFETSGQEFVDNHSHHDSDNTFMEDFKLEEFQDDTSYAESVPSVVDVAVSDKGDNRPQSAQRTIADSIKLHLETVKENMVSLERYARLADGDKPSDCSIRSVRSDKARYKDVLLHDNQLFCMWSRLVTFAYQLVQLNHGNCYYDYSSQLLTAVLACDALRRGVNRMCDILQSYVSPIKYSSDNSDNGSAVSCKRIKKEKSYVSKKIRKTSKYKINSSLHKTYVTKTSERNHLSDNLWQRHRKYSFENKMGHNKRTSQPWSGNWRRAERSHSSASKTLWPEELDEIERSCRCRKVVNPMLKLVRYLDDILKADIEDFGRI